MLQIENKNIKRILELYKEMHVLAEVGALLGWDQNVYMPAKAAAGRAIQSTYLQSFLTDKWVDREFRTLVEETEVEGLNDGEKAILRNLRHAAKFYYKVPKKLILENTRVTTEAFSIWQEAKKNNDFKSFAATLAHVFDLQKQIAGYLGYKDNPYDALLDMYEIGLTAIECSELFSQIRPAITNLSQKITSANIYKKSNPLIHNKHTFAIEVQKRLNEFILAKMHYSHEEGRLDVSSHPFTTTLGRHDVRITTRYSVVNLKDSLYSTIHEAGHALYELGVSDDYASTPLVGGVSLGVHESQSRFWENMIGKNPHFLRFLLPHLKKEFKEIFGRISFGELVQYINHVKPGYIRTEADEVTYNLHIILRFEMEQDIINGRLQTKDLPEVWREKMKTYLGIIPPNDQLGVLQDVHWSYGSIGYFPTYTIGNLYSAQILHAMKKDLKFDTLVAKGDLLPIRKWLQTHIHTYGSLYLPKELMKKATGEDLSGKHFVSYLTKKFSAIYSL